MHLRHCTRVGGFLHKLQRAQPKRHNNAVAYCKGWQLLCGTGTLCRMRLMATTRA
jgi:hypothetical protein